MDVDEVSKLLSMESGDPLVVRDRTMLEVMYGAGLRLSELVGLDVRHLDLAMGEVRVMGKGSKERKIPLGKTAVSWLKRWLEMRELYEPEDGAVFISTKSGKRISNRNVQKRFEQWGSNKGLIATLTLINCVTHLQHISLNQVVIYAVCKSCSVMQIYRRHKSTHT